MKNTQLAYSVRLLFAILLVVTGVTVAKGRCLDDPLNER